MTEKTIRLSGWKAVLVLLIVAGVGGYRVTTARAKIDTQGRAALEQWVQMELVRPLLADTTRSLQEQGAAIAQASSVTIRSLAVRGKLSNAVVRVELAPNPALPPGTDLVRYYRMRYTTISGWTHHGSATKLSWYLAAF
ncbi:MAG: hypothetical protein P8099_19595 [Gemmatimonadota bacterium]